MPYFQHLIFGWAKFQILITLIKQIDEIFDKIMMNTKYGPKSNGNKFIYTKAYNSYKTCKPSCGWEYEWILAYSLVVNPFKHEKNCDTLLTIDMKPQPIVGLAFWGHCSW